MSEAKELRAKAEFWVRLCALPRYSFIIKNNGLARIEDRVGSWVELHEVMKIVDAAQEKIDELTAELNCRAQPAAQAVPEGWIKLIDYLPPLGKYVVLCKDGVVQRVSFYLDQADSDFGGGEYFWATDDVDMDEFPAADFERDYWMPIPAAPTPPAGEVES